jgi:Flp pilus assembly protein TadG
MTRLRVRAGRGDCGSALVEFSLIAFMFIVVLIGVVELGRMLLVYNTLANAARAGARYAIVHGGERTGSGSDGPSGPGSVSEVQTVVEDYASAGLINTSDLTVNVTYPDNSNAAGSRVSVTVTYPFTPMVRYFNSMLSTTLGSTSEGVITF